MSVTSELFLEACRAGYIEVIKELINKGFNPDEGLINAIEKRNKDIVKYLLKKGANANAINNEGYSALSLAVFLDKEEIVELLLETGADIHHKKDEALILAAGVGRLEIIKLLFSKGAYIHAQDDNALIMAVKRENKITVNI